MCLQEHSCMKLYIYEQNNVNKANKSHQLIRYGLEYLLIYGRMSESIEQRTVFGYLCLFKNNVINYEVIRLSTQQCNKTYQLIRLFGIFLHLLKDVLSKKHFFDTCFFDNIVKHKVIFVSTEQCRQI